MLSEDHQVLLNVSRWLEQEQSVWLCTIVKTVGSSPRPVGSMLALNDAGESTGSLSGGCVEEDLLDRIRHGEFDGTRPAIVEYGLNAEENARLGLPCGGRLEVLIETLGADQGASGMFVEIADSLAKRRCILRHLDLETGNSSLEPVSGYRELVRDLAAVSRCYGPRMRMLLVGAGQLAQTLAELAQAMDYEVLVTDPRPDVLAQWPGPDLRLIAGMPDDAVREFAADDHSIVITLTHDPRIDDMALMEALTTAAWYVGALGSVNTTNKRLKRLGQLDLSDQQIARLHAPVGLDIGSKTPLEIAVAVMAEITSLRRRGCSLT
jgi:xanthine dehydrogenase accessory factor